MYEAQSKEIKLKIVRSEARKTKIMALIKRIKAQNAEINALWVQYTEGEGPDITIKAQLEAHDAEDATMRLQFEQLAFDHQNTEKIIQASVEPLLA